MAMPPLYLIIQPINFGATQQKVGLPAASQKTTAPMAESQQSAGSGATLGQIYLQLLLGKMLIS